MRTRANCWRRRPAGARVVPCKLPGCETPRTPEGRRRRPDRHESGPAGEHTHGSALGLHHRGRGHRRTAVRHTRLAARRERIDAGGGGHAGRHADHGIRTGQRGRHPAAGGPGHRGFAGPPLRGHHGDHLRRGGPGHHSAHRGPRAGHAELDTRQGACSAAGPSGNRRRAGTRGLQRSALFLGGGCRESHPESRAGGTRPRNAAGQYRHSDENAGNGPADERFGRGGRRPGGERRRGMGLPRPPCAAHQRRLRDEPGHVRTADGPSGLRGRFLASFPGGRAGAGGKRGRLAARTAASSRRDRLHPYRAGVPRQGVCAFRDRAAAAAALGNLGQ